VHLIAPVVEWPTQHAGLPSLPEIGLHAGMGWTVTKAKVPLEATDPSPDEPPLEALAWDDAELHDVLDALPAGRGHGHHVLAAGLHEDGWELAGLMFDLERRRGSAVFDQARMHLEGGHRSRLFTLVHELGHGFNLAHSWDKAAGEPWAGAVHDPASLSFMDYPHRVDDFWDRFEWTFAPGERAFLRHAPDEVVQPGSSAFFDDHGLATQVVDPPLVGHVEAPEDVPWGAPIRIAGSVVATRPVVLPGDDLSISRDAWTVTVRDPSGRMRVVEPFARAISSQLASLGIGDERWFEVLVDRGPGGVAVPGPGTYTFTLRLHAGSEALLHLTHTITVHPPLDRAAARIGRLFGNGRGARWAFFNGTRSYERELATVLQASMSSRDRAAREAVAFVFGYPKLREGRVLSRFGGQQALLRVPADPKRGLRGVRLALGFDGLESVGGPARPVSSAKALLRMAKLGAPRGEAVLEAVGPKVERVLTDRDRGDQLERLNRLRSSGRLVEALRARLDAIDRGEG
jgi:hypothetical protein